MDKCIRKTFPVFRLSISNRTQSIRQIYVSVANIVSVSSVVSVSIVAIVISCSTVVLLVFVMLLVLIVFPALLVFLVPQQVFLLYISTKVTCKNMLQNHSDSSHLVSQTCFHCKTYCTSLHVPL